MRLEHLRFGKNQPIYLFDLVPVSEGILSSANPHVCQDDCYTARMEYGSDVVQLTWSIAGPEKKETIHYQYR